MPTVDGAIVPDGVDLYDFEDFDTARDLLYKDAEETLKKQFPKEHNGVRMELADVAYAEDGNYTLAEQKKALQDDTYLGRRLRGTVRLFDTATGDLLDEKKMTLMKVPFLSDRGTVIREGNEWGTIAQQRLIPGAYSRYQKNGDLETQFNVRPGTGKAFRVNMNPASGQYKFSIAGSELHLYSLLHDVGISDDEMRKAWGDEVFEANAKGYDSRVFEKAYAKIVPDWDRKRNSGRTREEKIKMIQEALDRSQISSAVAKRTLPSLFNLAKAAFWRKGHTISKIASLPPDAIRNIATYMNDVMDTDIDPYINYNELGEKVASAIKKYIIEDYENMEKNASAEDVVRHVGISRLFTFVENQVSKYNG